MAAWLDQKTNKFVPMPNHRLQSFGIAENSRESLVVYRALRIWIVIHVEALPEMRLRPMPRNFSAPSSAIQSSPFAQFMTDGGSAGKRNRLSLRPQVPLKKRRDLFDQ